MSQFIFNFLWQGNRPEALFMYEIQMALRYAPEYWCSLSDYESYYQVSNLGRIRSLNRIVKEKGTGKTYKVEGKLLKPWNAGKNVLKVNLHIEGEGKSIAVYRLVAEVFLHQSDLTIDHINGWRLDNNIVNLRYLSIGDNARLAKYSVKRAALLEIATKAPSLLDLWESYKLVSKERVAATTKKTHWFQYETNYLGDIFKKDASLLEIMNSDKFISYLLEKYKPATIKPIFSNCLMPSVNLAVKKGTIERNPYLDVELPKGVSSEIDCYSSDEVKMIIQAFYDSASDYYGTLIEFIALTGCRPEEAVALTANDVKTKGGRTYIKFSKAYSNRILLPHTKNRAIRLFPVNEQLETLINFIEPQKNRGTNETPKGLFFPSPKGKYITWNNVRNRHWIPVINKLIEQGKLDR